jgi:hypothetical protein
MADNNTAEPTGEDSEGVPVSPELVRQVAEKVYALWLREMRIEGERRRISGSRSTAAALRQKNGL